MEDLEHEIKKLKTKWKIRRIINIFVCFPFAVISGSLLLILRPLGTKFDNIGYGVVLLLFAIFFPILHRWDKERYDKKISQLINQEEQNKQNPTNLKS